MSTPDGKLKRRRSVDGPLAKIQLKKIGVANAVDWDVKHDKFEHHCQEAELDAVSTRSTIKEWLRKGLPAKYKSHVEAEFHDKVKFLGDDPIDVDAEGDADGGGGDDDAHDVIGMPAKKAKPDTTVKPEPKINPSAAGTTPPRPATRSKGKGKKGKGDSAPAAAAAADDSSGGGGGGGGSGGSGGDAAPANMEIDLSPLEDEEPKDTVQQKLQAANAVQAVRDRLTAKKGRLQKQKEEINKRVRAAQDELAAVVADEKAVDGVLQRADDRLQHLFSGGPLTGTQPKVSATAAVAGAAPAAPAAPAGAAAAKPASASGAAPHLPLTVPAVIPVPAAVAAKPAAVPAAPAAAPAAPAPATRSAAKPAAVPAASNAAAPPASAKGAVTSDDESDADADDAAPTSAAPPLPATPAK